VGILTLFEGLICEWEENLSHANVACNALFAPVLRQTVAFIIMTVPAWLAAPVNNYKPGSHHQ
jgi:hypothetical protein